jgi:LytS/YehU family sensor histidine kinase
MYRRNYGKRIVIAGLLLAISVIIPYIFHTSGIAGTVFLPMHIPVLLGGFLLPPHLAFLLGVLAPILNSLVSGMPPLFPMAIIMMVELGFYGLITSLLYRKLRVPSILTLLISMAVGRVMAGVMVFLLAIFFSGNLAPAFLDPVAFIAAGVAAGLPGIIIQLILIPTLVYSIMRYTTIDLD